MHNFLSLHRFICKNNGVLFENDLLQIGVKSEYRSYLGRLGLFFGNKTSYQFTGFSSTVTEPNANDILLLYFLMMVMFGFG